MKTFKNFAIALVAISLVTTSCLDNTEPAGIAALRGAKSEYIKAQTLVEQANAELIKAEVAIKTAQAKQEEATAAKMQYAADIEKLNLELRKAQDQAAIEAIARQKQVLDAQLQATLEAEKAALLQAQATTQAAQEAYLKATAQLNILKITGIPDMYKAQYTIVYGKLSTAWNNVNAKQSALLTNQNNIQKFDSYSNANQILTQETTIANKGKEITAAQKALADYKLLNDKTLADQKTLLAGYETKLSTAITTLAGLNNSITTQVNTLNDLYVDLKTKNNAYSSATLFTYKLAVPAALQTSSLVGGAASTPVTEIVFNSGSSYFTVSSPLIAQFNVSSGSTTSSPTPFTSKVYTYKAPSSIVTYSPEYFNQYIWEAQEIADNNASLASLLTNMNAKKDNYNGATNGNLKAWQDAVTAYNANPSAANQTTLNSTSTAVWGVPARTLAVDAVWNPLTSLFEDKNSAYTFNLSTISNATYVIYIRAKYNYESLQTTIANQIEIKKMFDAATTALAKIKTDVLAISDPIKAKNDDYDAKVIAISSTVTSKNLAVIEQSRYETLVDNINTGVTGYDTQIATLTQTITNLEQQKKALEETLAEYKKNPTMSGQFVEILRKEATNLQTEITDLGKEIETYTKQLATLLEYINGTK